MRWSHMLGGLALVLLLTMLGLAGLSYAQGAGSLTDFRDKSSYSAEELAQALFAEPVSSVRTRGVGPAKALPSLPPTAVSRTQCAVRTEFGHASVHFVCGG